jgi:SagB-type dehydrogenase family enzyme
MTAPVVAGAAHDPTSEAPSQRDLLPELSERLAALGEQEQQMLARMLRRAADALPADRELDEVSLAHASFKADFETALSKDYQELMQMHAPPVFKEYPGASRVALPRELVEITHTLVEVIKARASRRDFGGDPLPLTTLSTLLHHSYGVRKLTSAYNVSDFPTRFVPSAGGLQAVELYLIVNSVEDLAQGLYHYSAPAHELELVTQGLLRRKVVGSSFMQEWMHHASVICVLTCVMERVEWKYGARGYRMLHVDAGHLSQSLHMLATALKLRSTVVSGFFDAMIDDILGIDGRSEFATLLVPIGTKPEPSAALPQP